MPLGVSPLLQLLIIRGDISVSVVLNCANRHNQHSQWICFSHATSGYSRKLSVMLKFILQLGQVGNDALALIGLLIFIYAYNRAV